MKTKWLQFSIVSFLLLFVITSVVAQEKKDSKTTQNKTITKENKAPTNTGGKTDTKNSKTTTVKGNITDTKNNQPTAKTENKLTYEAIQQISTPVIEQTQNGLINWTEQYIEAKGSSVIDRERFKIEGQAKAMAIRGAIVIAQRNLLEIINGVNVTSETRVQDMIATSDYVYTRVDGLIRGAQQVGEAIEKDGMMEVTMRVPLYAKNGLAPIVYTQLPQNKGKYPETNKKSMASDDPAGMNVDMQLANNPNKQEQSNTQSILPEGLVFDFNGKKLDPSMFPVVVDENGNLLLDMSALYNPNEGKFPKILQSTKTIFNELGFQKGVEVINVVDGTNGKLVVDKKSASKVDWGKIANTVSSVVDVFKFVVALL